MSTGFCIKGKFHPFAQGGYFETILEQKISSIICLDHHNHTKEDLEVNVYLPHEISWPTLFLYFIHNTELSNIFPADFDLRTWIKLLNFLCAPEHIFEQLKTKFMSWVKKDEQKHHHPLLYYSAKLIYKYDFKIKNPLDIEEKFQFDEDWLTFCQLSNIMDDVLLSKPLSWEEFTCSARLPLSIIEFVSNEKDVYFIGDACIPLTNSNGYQIKSLLPYEGVLLGFFNCNQNTIEIFLKLYELLLKENYILFYPDEITKKETTLCQLLAISKNPDLFQNIYIYFKSVPSLKMGFKICSFHQIEKVAYNGKMLMYTQKSESLWNKNYFIDDFSYGDFHLVNYYLRNFTLSSEYLQILKDENLLENKRLLYINPMWIPNLNEDMMIQLIINQNHSLLETMEDVKKFLCNMIKIK